ncbi:NAD-dependent epimerase/dehydratase family protein [Dehalococcoidia bacterium]|nr:NAD-dependent epimerase/dehydratase family protein [Dehalococcoidia bacterium]
MKIMVTGGAGFIGSHIVDALIEKGHQVVVVDNLTTGSRQNINPSAKFYEMSICDSELASIFERERPEIVSHQAAQVVITRSVAEPIFDARENILGSLNVILNCVRFGARKIIYASSGGAIYGEPHHLPVNETHPINPLSQYGISKHTVEHYLHLYGLQHRLSWVALRYPNVYGPRQNPNGEAGVVAIFAGQMLRGEQPTIFGSGDKTRDYTHVFDVVAANLLAMERDNAGIYNIGTGVETSDKEMFDTLAKVLGYFGSPRYAPVRAGEVYRICLDATKAQEELGWQAGLSLEEGLLETVSYYEERFGPADQ